MVSTEDDVIKEYNYNSNDYKILYNFKARSKGSVGAGITAMKALTLKDIASDTNLSHVKVRQAIFNFLEDGFVKEGIKKVRAKTYFITEKGLNELVRLSEI